MLAGSSADDNMARSTTGEIDYGMRRAWGRGRDTSGWPYSDECIAYSRENRQDTSTKPGGHDHLKGHVGAWSPRQPQWQHWGALWFTGAGCSCARWQTGTDAAHGWWALERVQRGCEREEVVAACMVVRGWVARDEWVVVGARARRCTERSLGVARHGWSLERRRAKCGTDGWTLAVEGAFMLLERGRGA